MTSLRPVAVGAVFRVVRGKHIDRYRREDDDAAATLPSERLRVTHLSCFDALGFAPYTFSTEPEWFVQRGLVAS